MPELAPPDVPAVDPPGAELAVELLLGLVEPGALLVEPGALLLLDPVLLDEEPMRALVNIHCPARLELLAVDPAVPLVPVAPLPPPCRQPVTVIVRLLLLEV
jgi:hypothetical protein